MVIDTVHRFHRFRLRSRLVRLCRWRNRIGKAEVKGGLYFRSDGLFPYCGNGLVFLIPKLLLIGEPMVFNGLPKRVEVVGKTGLIRIELRLNFFDSYSLRLRLCRHLLCMFLIMPYIQMPGKVFPQHSAQFGGNSSHTAGVGKLHCRLAVWIGSDFDVIMDDTPEILEQVIHRNAV